MSEADNAPDLVGDLRQALADSPFGKNQTSPDSNVGTSNSVEGAVTPVSQTDESNLDPAPRPAMDLSIVPDSIRPEISRLSEATQRAIKDGFMIKSEFTKKTQALAEQARTLTEENQSYKEDATLWRKLKADHEAFKNLANFLQARANGAADQPDHTNHPSQDQEDEEVDFLDPQAAKKWREKVRKEAAQEALRAIDEQVYAPQRMMNAVGMALKQRFIVEQGLSKELVERAASQAGLYAEKTKFQVTPENVADFVDPFVQLEKAKTQVSAAPAPQRSQVNAPVTRVATPPMSGGISPPVRPMSPMNGKDDYHNAVYRELSNAWGEEVSESDLKSILANIGKSN